MDEATWLSATDPAMMLDFLRGKASTRKLKLFARACVHRFLPVLAGPMSERLPANAPEEFRALATDWAASADHWATPDDALSGAGHVTRYVARVMGYAGKVAQSEECSAQASVLRCLFGNPFRPSPTLPQSWRKTVLALAQRVHDKQDFPSMPALADALEKAGCTTATILDHLNGPGPHVRGCWALAAILRGKQ